MSVCPFSIPPPYLILVVHFRSAVLVCPGFIRTSMTTGVKAPMPGPEAVANVISSLIKRPRREVFVPGIYWWMTRLAQISPPLTDFLLARINRSEV